MIYYEDLIGKPFEYGGRGPDSYDCYGLVMTMLARQGVTPFDFGWHDESAAIEAMMLSALDTGMWESCEMQPGSVLLFRVGRFTRHVGFAVSHSRFVHCWERSGGVVSERLSEDWNSRLKGCYRYVKTQ